VSEPLQHSALVTDLYELTMSAAYFESQFQPIASFELFVRALPPQRSFLVTAGLEQALEYLETVRFTPEQIAYLRAHPMFGHISQAFFDYLRDFRFTGDVWAMPEGTPAFGDEPLLRITAPIIQAQVVETFLLSTLTFQTMIASKAARVVEAAQGKPVVEFGSRRAHGPEAGILAARAAYLAGCSGTSNVEAGQRFGIPTFGTQAHSFIMAHASEEESFRQFHQLFPDHAVLLIDTYDTLAAVDKIIRSGMRPQSVRLDSGDMIELTREVRHRLDRAGLTETKIFVSGDLDEFVIADLMTHALPIDAFGVGTALATSKDAPALSGVYKLVDVDFGQGPSSRVKLSDDKTSYPCRKQVFRESDAAGKYDGDVIGQELESYPGAEPLLVQVMKEGKRAGLAPSLPDICERTQANLEKLPHRFRRLQNPERYPVRFSHQLQAKLEEMRLRLTQPVEP
jgi:nicotinate phosphoribosyltransferase